ncbi:LPXTG cell wall anchor domain-containing protein, partial [Terribacillus saccharophilus]
TASFGDVTDTEWRTVTFQAKIESDYAGKGIENVAAVSGDNIETPDQPSKRIDVESQEPDEPADTEGPSSTPSDDTTTTPPKAEKPSNVTDTDTNEKPQAEEANHLPNTATNIYNMLIVGFALLLLGLTIWFVRSRKAN